MSELESERVGVRAGDIELLSELTLRAPAGSTVGLIGPNGSGKSTALRCVYRALRPSAGLVRVGGQDVRATSLRSNAQAVAALTQQHESDLDLTVRELVALGRAPYRRGNQPLSAHERDVCRDAMQRLDVTHLADRGMLSLSGGERQRVLIARTRPRTGRRIGPPAPDGDCTGRTPRAGRWFRSVMVCRRADVGQLRPRLPSVGSAAIRAVRHSAASARPQ